jgi:hypothetical protein
MEVAMCRLLSGTAVSSLIAAALWIGGAAAPSAAKEGCHGTTINFVDSPSEAARQAKKEEKLVFVLHVSGHFEDPRFT